MKALCFLLLPLVTLAQKSILPPPEPTVQAFGRPWTVAFSWAGWQGFGPGASIVQKMRDTGWESTNPGGCFFGCTGPTNFPRVRKNVTADLEITYQKSRRHGYQLSLGMPLTAEITGRSSNGPYLYLQSRIYYGSFRWAWFGLKGRLIGSAGPALLLVQDFEKLGSQAGPRHSQLSPGMHLSGQFRFINKRIWLLAAKADARIGLPSSTGTYEHEAYTYTPQGSQQKTLQFSAENIPTFHMNLGLQLGFKLLKRTNLQ
ncbi:hypothetical protein HNV11_02275 [Spirosoma taeanense]|uniref:Outer membrane protein beta-barrel domain-containing protein n=1 Tax=Spirosoma taeanense TaxID=2735870 RepID=A0A6M5Y4E4_9BACT|nr:hypothetical protein [Spirosoma taeanense]QJW88284.1 hypothetical protein HNV11_02275 [Spirosoma taeanense]